jgi:DnaJ-class molecular chaperone
VSYRELEKALQVFGLERRATLAEVKSRHRELAKRYHPDSGDDADPAMMRKVNAAYRVLSGYISNYSFSFTEEEFYEQNPDERLRQQFMDDPIWGGGKG